MDHRTIGTYNNEAEKIAQLHSNLTPTRIYELVTQFFIPYGNTLDIGCGIGRDTYWLTQHGYPTIGIDASYSMLKYSKKLYPNNTFILDHLPDLVTQQTKVDNILCSAVLMHLDNIHIIHSCRRLLSLLNKNGIMIISYRSTNEVDNRENGKLYSDINIVRFLEFFINHGCSILLQESNKDERRDIVWNNFVIQK